MRCHRYVAILLLLTACAGVTPASSVPTSSGISPAPDRGLLSAAEREYAERWLTDGIRRLSAEAGAIRGVAVALDSRQHAHFVYQTSIEWMDSVNEGAVIVMGTTPSGDRYEQRLWTATKGFDANSIASWGEHIVVTAGTRSHNRETGLQTLRWDSVDGGRSWSGPQPVQIGSKTAYRADVAFTPDGQVVLVASVVLGAGQIQTYVLREQPGGSVTALLFPVQPGGSQQTIWMRSPDHTHPSALPALVALISTTSGFLVGRSDNGVQWMIQQVASVPAYTPRITAAGGSLIVVHHQYGHAGLWIARSDDGGVTWHVGRAFQELLHSPTDGISVEDAYPLWNARQEQVFLVLIRFDRAAKQRRIAVVGTALSTILDGTTAWTPALDNQPWMPITLTANHSDQMRPYVIQQSDLAIIGWEGWFIPTDPRNATDGDFRASSEPNYAIVRVSALNGAWQAAQERGAR